MSYPNAAVEQSGTALKEAIGAIQLRMEQWGGSNIWLETDAVRSTQKCFSDFYRYFGKKNLSDLEIDGWECGLGQILDLTDPRICKVLPYLLTAYMYNFAASKSEKYVRNFVKDVPQAQRTYKDDSFFGVRHSIEMNCSYGIGKLFCGEVPSNDPKWQEEIKGFSERFRFPQTIKKTLQTGFSCKVNYVIPAEKESSFSAGIKENVWIDYDTNAKLKCYTPAASMEKFERDRFFNIFIVWYHVLKLASEPVHRRIILRYSPDPVSNFYLIQSALHFEIADSETDGPALENKIDRFFEGEYKLFVSRFVRKL